MVRATLESIAFQSEDDQGDGEGSWKKDNRPQG